MFKKIIYSLVAVSMLAATTSCNDWLEVKPNNEQITKDFWQSKEDVESVVISGYVYLANSVPTLIRWGELRGTMFRARSSSNERLQNFNITPSHNLCKYDVLYQIINSANSVIKYAPGVRAIDGTYHEAQLNAHLCEAYFLRAYANLILVKNFKEVPLIIEPYVDDSAPFDIAKSSEEDIIAQIKSDIMTALNTGAAKSHYGDDIWENQGRVTKWALYALMADVCLWSEDYEMCKIYCDEILYANDNFRPVLLKETSKWFEIFNPGNSNEGIFEVCWNYGLSDNKNNNFQDCWKSSVSSDKNDKAYEFLFTTYGVELVKEEYEELAAIDPLASGRVGRMDHCSVIPNGSTGITNTLFNDLYLWKYLGSTEVEVIRTDKSSDANFILYRVADIVLMKALAETMTHNYTAAFTLLNEIRNRAGLQNFEGIGSDDSDNIAALDELTLLRGIIRERMLEFIGEAKSWYDILWFSRIMSGKYHDEAVSIVVESNQTTNDAWIASALSNPYAWYMPLPQGDIDHNRLLVQNPYYSSK